MLTPFRTVVIGSRAQLAIAATNPIPPGSYSCGLDPAKTDIYGRQYECVQIFTFGGYTPMFNVPGVGTQNYQDYPAACSSYQHGVSVLLAEDLLGIDLDMTACTALQLSYIQKTAVGTGNYKLRYTLNGMQYDSERFDIIGSGRAIFAPGLTNSAILRSRVIR